MKTPPNGYICHCHTLPEVVVADFATTTDGAKQHNTMKKLLLTMTALVGLLTAFSGCKKNEPNSYDEEIRVIATSSHNDMYNGMEVVFSAIVTGGEANEVLFYFDGQQISSLISPPYQIKYQIKDIAPGDHRLVCIAKVSGKEYRGEAVVSLKLRLGDEYQGGKIFSLNSDGKSGLIAATRDLEYSSPQGAEVGFSWGDISVIGTSLDDGKSNTQIMAAHAIHPSSAGYHFKNGYNYNGYNDWYIPSIKELEMLKSMMHLVGGFVESNVFWKNCYWSSSEKSAQDAFGLNFYVLSANYDLKVKVKKIRPIRQF